MSRLAALSLLCAMLSACAQPARPAAAPAPEAPVATVEASLVEAPPPEAPEPAPAPKIEPTLALPRGDEAARVAMVSRHAGDAFGFFSPRLVKRGYGEVLTLQVESDRGRAAGLSLLETPLYGVHAPPVPAEREERCQVPLGKGSPIDVPAGSARVNEGPLGDEIVLGTGRGARALKLPRGAFHGGCLDGDKLRVHFSWSTPEAPADVHVLSLRSGTTRRLTVHARPGLGGLGDLEVTDLSREGVSALALRASHTTPRGIAVMLDDSSPRPAAFSGLARALAEQGLVVVRAHRSAAAQAVGMATGRFKGPVSVIARGASPPPLVEGTTPIWLLPDNVSPAALPDASIALIAEGDASLARVASLIDGEGARRFGGGGAGLAARGRAWALAVFVALGKAEEPAR